MATPSEFVDGYAFSEAEEEERAKEGEAAFYCLLFYSRNTTLDCEVADYVIAQSIALNAMFGPRLHGFAIALPGGGDTKEAVIDMYEYARAYHVGPDQFPCALVSTTLQPSEKALKLPFGAFLPPSERRENDDVALAFQAIAAAAERCADVSARRRIAVLQRSLRDARNRVYGERVPKGERVLNRVDGDVEILARIASNGTKLVATATAAATLALGGPGVATVGADAGLVPTAGVTRIVEGSPAPGGEIVVPGHERQAGGATEP